jgi:hypothetical protein
MAVSERASAMYDWRTFRRRWRIRRMERERSRAAARARGGDGPNRFWKSLWEGLNRPFLIFVIGTLVAGTFISVRDASTRCYDELAVTQDALLAAVDELTDRRIAFWKIIAATSFEELTDLKSIERRERRWFQSAFKDTKVDALKRRIYQLSARFEDPDGKSWSPWEINISTVSSGPLNDPAAFNLEEGWQVDDDLKASGLDKAKEYATNLIDLVVGLSHENGPNQFRSFQPRCGFGSSLIRVITGHPGVIGTAFDD